MGKPQIPANTPDRIYLQIGDDASDTDWKDLAEVTWCPERIFDTDLEYKLVRRPKRTND